jgi:hypothetical protein
MMALPTTHDSHNAKDVLCICAQEDVFVVRWLYENFSVHYVLTITIKLDLKVIGLHVLVAFFHQHVPFFWHKLKSQLQERDQNTINMNKPMQPRWRSIIMSMS